MRYAHTVAALVGYTVIAGAAALYVGVKLDLIPSD